MTLYIAAQLIGLIGYAFLIIAPQFQTQAKIMQFSILASAILCTQWFMLDQYSLLIMNALLILTTLCALKAGDNPSKRKYLPLLYPIGFCALISVSDGSITDMIALIAFSFTVASRTSNNLKDFRIYAILAGVTLSVCGALALSIPAIVFNAAFTLSHMSKLGSRKEPQHS